MNLWGRKCSPCPTPPPTWLLSYLFSSKVEFMKILLLSDLQDLYYVNMKSCSHFPLKPSVSALRFKLEVVSIHIIKHYCLSVQQLKVKLEINLFSNFLIVQIIDNPVLVLQILYLYLNFLNGFIDVKYLKTYFSFRIYLIF